MFKKMPSPLGDGSAVFVTHEQDVLHRSYRHSISFIKEEYSEIIQITAEGTEGEREGKKEAAPFFRSGL
jgi:hypothetical protein